MSGLPGTPYRRGKRMRQTTPTLVEWLLARVPVRHDADCATNGRLTLG